MNLARSIREEHGGVVTGCISCRGTENGMGCRRKKRARAG